MKIECLLGHLPCQIQDRIGEHPCEMHLITNTSPLDKVLFFLDFYRPFRRCHDNARCESIWARMKNELFELCRRNLENYTIEELKTLIWRYFTSYWNNQRICSVIGGIPLAEKRRRYYAALSVAT